MKSIQPSPRVFLATPITPLLGADGMIAGWARAAIETILDSLRTDLGCSVFCAIEREAWGAELMPGIECTALDLAGMRESDCVLAFPGESFGVHVELGWASALDLPIFVSVHEEIGTRTPLVDGLPTITRAVLHVHRSASVLPDPSEWSELRHAFERFLRSDVEARLLTRGAA